MVDNQYKYGITYGLDGRITGFALSPDKWVALSESEIFDALEKVAKEKRYWLDVWKEYFDEQQKHKLLKETTGGKINE